MAEKIVQLIDNQGNNVYPVAGSMKQGSVTTNMLNDGAVTADKIDDGAVTNAKIDYSTIQGGNVPIATSSMHIPYFSSLASNIMNLWRIGNIVFAFANVVTSSMSAYDTTSASEVMPSGFRPVTGTIGLFTLNAVVGTNTTMSVTISDTGATWFSNRVAVSSSTRFNGYGCWITKDNWPS